MANENTVRVHFIDGSEKIVPAKDIQYVGEEGARKATALVDGREVPIYKRSEPRYTVDELEVWLNEKSEDDEEDEGDGSGLHQCPYCYNLVSEEHEEFCWGNPDRNRNIVP